MTGDRFVVTASPHLRGPGSTPKIMWSVAASLVPVMAGATYFFGPSALLVVAAATAGAVATEALLGPRRALRDGSAAVTGVLLGLTLPAGLPLWMAAVGGGFAIGFGKLLFGGLGANIFNPALVGRAFLQAAFPVAITTWPPVGPGWAPYATNFALPFTTTRAVDTVTGATPLGLMKFEGTGTPIWDLVIGRTGGSLGETAGLLLLLGGAYLAARNYLNWRIPVAILATVALLSGGLSLLEPARYPGPLFMLFSGGLLLGALYMATDPVTSPVTHRGCWLFGAGIGLLVVVIRLWGGLPEGVMYAILFMNPVVPLINKATQPRVFGTGTSRGPGGPA